MATYNGVDLANSFDISIGNGVDTFINPEKGQTNETDRRDSGRSGGSEGN